MAWDPRALIYGESWYKKNSTPTPSKPVSSGSPSGSTRGGPGSGYISPNIGTGIGVSLIPGLTPIGGAMAGRGLSQLPSSMSPSTQNMQPTQSAQPTQSVQPTNKNTITPNLNQMGVGLQTAGLGLMATPLMGLTGFATQQTGQQLTGGKSIVPEFIPNQNVPAPELKQEITPLPGSLAQAEQVRQWAAAPELQEITQGRIEVQAGSLKMMNQTLDMIGQLEQQLMQRMKDMLGGVDEATMWALQGVRKTVEEQRNRLLDEMNRRGLLQSGIWLEEENKINAGQLDAESQIRLSRVSELQNMLMNGLQNFANQRISAMQQYGKDYVNAIDQEYQNRMKAWQSATGQAMDWVQSERDYNQRKQGMEATYTGYYNPYFEYAPDANIRNQLAPYMNDLQAFINANPNSPLVPYAQNLQFQKIMSSPELKQKYGGQYQTVAGMQATLTNKAQEIDNLVNQIKLSYLPETLKLEAEKLKQDVAAGRYSEDLALAQLNNIKAQTTKYYADSTKGGKGGSNKNETALKVETYYKNQLPSYFETPQGYYTYLIQPEQAQKIIADIGAAEYKKLVDYYRKYL